MNILVVHEIDWKHKVVYDVHEFPERLSLRGHTVVFVDYEESWRRSAPWDVVRVRTRVEPAVHRLYDGASVELRTPGLVRLPMLDRVSSVGFQFAEILRTIRRERIDVVLLYAMPTSGLSAILAARLSDVPVVFRAIDVLHLLRPEPISTAIRVTERLGLPRVDAVAALTHRMKQWVCSFGVPGDRVAVIGTGVDSALFYPAPRDDDVSREYGLMPADRVAMFLGTMYGFSGLDFVIRGLPRVVSKVPSAKLLLVGGGDHLDAFKELARSCGVADRVVFTGMQPIQRLPRLITAGDIAFNSFRRSLLTDSVLPEKIPRYMACGRPVLLTPLTATREILVGERNGVVFRDLGDAYLDAMAELLADGGRRTELGAAALRYARKHHDWDVLVSRLEGLLEDAVARGRGTCRLAR